MRVGFGINSVFFCELSLFAMALQSWQGCFPSKVSVTACGMESLRRELTSIPAQAADCMTAH